MEDVKLEFPSLPQCKDDAEVSARWPALPQAAPGSLAEQRFWPNCPRLFPFSLGGFSEVLLPGTLVEEPAWRVLLTTRLGVILA